MIKKKTFFLIISLIIPLIFIFLFEMFLRLISYGDVYPLFIEDQNNRNYLIQNKNVGKRYFTDLDEVPFASYDPFLKTKTHNCYRIFVIGESTAAGFPYSHGVSFPRQLQHLLNLTYPDKKIEVINTSMAAISSFTFYDFMDEISAQNPDLIIFHGGHNEYYGAFAVGSFKKSWTSPALIRTYLKILDFRIIQLIRNMLRSVLYIGNNEHNQASLMGKLAGKDNIAYDSDLFHAGIETFRSNYQRVLDKAAKNGIPIISSTIVSNEKDIMPLDVLSQLPKESSSILSKHLTSNLNEKKYPFDFQITEAFQNFEKGVSAYDNLSLIEAKNAFLAAKDLDVVRFRAPSQINEILMEEARSRNVPVVNIYKEFENASKDGIIGSSLITEHLHPNYSGYSLMAKEFFKTIISEGLIGPFDGDIDEILSKAALSRPFTDLEVQMGNMMLQQLMHKWPFVNWEYDGENYEISNYQVTSFAEELAKKNHLQEVSWPEAIYAYIGSGSNVNDSLKLSAYTALSLEYPYVGDIQLQKIVTEFNVFKDSSAFSAQILKIVGLTPSPELNEKVLNASLDNNMFELAYELMDRYTFNIVNIGLLKQAVRDILVVNSKSVLTPDAMDYIQAAGASLYLKKDNLAVIYLNEAERLGGDANSINQLRKKL
jgi:lysophospholipase L1-like esterase